MVELLEGVELLSVNESLPGILVGLLILFGLASIGLSTYLVAVSFCEDYPSGFLIGWIFTALSITLIVFTIKTINNPTPTYKVTVDDSVSINEFYERYEILDVDGKIYTIQERKDGSTK